MSYGRKVKATGTAIALAIALPCLIGTASAAPINLPGGQPIYIQFNNLEQVDTSGANSIVVPGGYNGINTQGNWGVADVSSMQLGAVATPHQDIGGGPVFFFDDGPGGTQGQITGIFYGINLTSGTTATGGMMDLFWHDPGSDPITANCLAGTTCAPDAATVAQFTSGTFLARLDFQSGIITGDNVTTIQSNVNLFQPLTGNGHSDSFASVDTTSPGPWTAPLNSDWFWVDTNGDGIFGGPGELRDVRMSTFFNGLTSWNDLSNAAIVGLRSNDPARAFTVPEPNSLALMGLALVGLAAGVTLRRRGTGAVG